MTDDPETDLARRDAFALGTEAWTRLVSAAGASPRRLARQAIAWRHGRSASVKAAEEPAWHTDARVMAVARQALVDAGAPASTLRVRRNRLTLGDVQIRRATDDTWWRSNDGAVPGSWHHPLLRNLTTCGTNLGRRTTTVATTSVVPPAKAGGKGPACG